MLWFLSPVWTHIETVEKQKFEHAVEDSSITFFGERVDLNNHF